MTIKQTAILMTLLVGLSLTFPSVYAQNAGVVNNVDIPDIKLSDDLKLKFYHEQPLTCIEGSERPIKQHLATFTDTQNNTIDIYCEWTAWQGENRPDARQFVAYYNKIMVIGLCPYDSGKNTYTVSTDEQGVINETTWLSVNPDGIHSVSYHNTFNVYDSPLDDLVIENNAYVVGHPDADVEMSEEIDNHSNEDEDNEDDNEDDDDNNDDEDSD